jgi:hypothetical protein
MRNNDLDSILGLTAVVLPLELLELILILNLLRVVGRASILELGSATLATVQAVVELARSIEPELPFLTWINTYI